MIRFEDSQRAIAIYTSRVHRRARAAGAHSLQREDIQGELIIAWCKARDAFEPEKGVPFPAFLQKGMRDHINYWIKGQIAHAQMASLDMTLSDDSDASLENVVADESIVRADDALANDETRRIVLQNLSAKTRVVIEAIENPPVEVMAELGALRAKGQHAKEIGMRGSVPKSVTPTMIFDLFGYTRADRVHVYQELKQAAQLAAA